ncbi:DUF2238 domain-containing protein [Candidatus Woesearchaeota archaeon]|nr:DUF2238 domain-containing protein [Candidatus Woesearchaeota archaeon]
MKKSTEAKTIKWIIIATLLFFVAWGIYTISTGNVEFIFDRLFSAAIVLAALFLYKKMNLKLPVIIIGLFTLVLHHLKLYGNVYLGIPFDRIMHFTAGFAIALVFYQYLLSLEQKKQPNKIKIFFLSVCIAAGISSMIEIIEFIGYSILGQGEGLLFYGTGDFGEWNNVSWDLICNTSGAVFASLLSSFYTIKNKKKFFKKLLKYIISIVLIIIVYPIMEPFIFGRGIDPAAKDYDFNYVLDTANINKTTYISLLEESKNQNISNFAKADILLILGRLTNNNTVLCSSVYYYNQTGSSNPEELALAYETIASLNCNSNSKEYYEKASTIWQSLNNKFRAELTLALANNQQSSFVYNISNITKAATNEIKRQNKVVIGKSKITLTKDDILVSQTDRVTRDWLSAQLNQSPYGKDLLTVFSEKFTLPEEELLPEIGWHEGARIKELSSVNLTHKTASGTIAIKIKDKWYAPDENGIFRFEILEDKILYPTTRFLKPDIAVIIDTHGISSIVEQAIRYNATTVIGCCDYPAKISAAQYLSEKGINVICLTDRFLPQALFQANNILGSPPIRKRPFSFIIGDHPLTISRYEKIIVMYLSPKSEIYGLQYYDTPSRYFKELKKAIDLNVKHIQITDFNQMDKIIQAANSDHANIIAVRVFNSDDYNKVSEWLAFSKQHKAILFHSASYPYGYKLFKEFPDQTTFDDPSPIII